MASKVSVLAHPQEAVVLSVLLCHFDLSERLRQICYQGHSITAETISHQKHLAAALVQEA